MQTMAKKRTGSRHKDRNMVSLPGDIYSLMKQLAEKERRPLSIQLLIAVEEHLRARGIPLPGEGDGPVQNTSDE